MPPRPGASASQACPVSRVQGRRRPFWWQPILPVLCLGLGAPALADSTLEASITQRGVYDSSPRLASTDTQSVSGYILEPRASLDFVGERWEIGNILRLTFPFYDNDDFNLNEQRYDLIATRLLPRGNFTISSTLERGSTLTNGLVDELGGLINDNDEVVATRRSSALLRPQWTRAISERNQLVIGASTSFVDFEDRTVPLLVDDGRTFDVDAPGQLTDFRFDGADLTLQRAVTERTNVFATAAVSRFDADSRLILTESTLIEQSNENFSRQLQVGVTHAFTATVSGTFRVGGRLVDSETTVTDVLLGTAPQTASEDSSGGVFDASLSWSPQRTQITLNASRSLAPSGVGQLLEQDRFSILARRELRPGLVGTLRLGYIERARFVGDEPFAREVIRVDPTLRWRMREHWTLVGGARFADVRDANDVERDGVRVFVNLVYDFSKSPVFR